MRAVLFIAYSLAAFLLLLSGRSPLAAQEDVRLDLLEIDATEFPFVHITIATRDNISAPVDDLSRLSLRENGTPVTDLSLDSIPVGVDVTFILDANVGFNEVDDEGGLTRREKVRDSIIRFADQYMNSDGLDRVSIVVPSSDGQSPEWLVQDATSPAEVVAAIQGYEPTVLRPTPLNAMFTAALEQMQLRQEENRYRALLLFSETRRLPDQLSFPILTAQASDSAAPINVAILGSAADEQEIATARRLFEPTQGTYVHMPQGTEADTIYDIWQRQGNQIRLTYRSRQRQNGRSQINVNLGSALAGGSFDLELQPPQVIIQHDALDIERSGLTADTDLSDLEPRNQPLTVDLVWPDGLTRALSQVSLLVNGQPATLLNPLPQSPVDMLTLEWDISEFNNGEFDLVVTVTDELGYQGTSEAIPAQITVNLPAAPTAASATIAPATGAANSSAETEQPASIALPSLFENLSVNLPSIGGDLAAAIAGLGLFLIVALFWRTRRRDGVTEQVGPIIMTPVDIDDDETEPLVARLEPYSNLPLQPVEFVGDNITVGRTSGQADIVIDHPSVAHLHARIRNQDDEYWLFDEGSSEGTYLNFERLGLAPRKVQDGDAVQFGRVSYRFRLRPEGTVEPGADAEAIEPEAAVILDMDGLMVDTEPLSRQAWDQVLADLGFGPLDDEFYDSLIGHRLWETSEMLVLQYQLPIEPSELAWRKEVLFAEMRSAGIPAMPGLYELVAALRQRQIPWGVATSSPRHLAEEILTQMRLLDACQVIAAGDEVGQGKPAPDVYLLAAERMHIDPRHCLGLEDSVPGCRSASAAGMVTIAIPNSQAMWDNFDCADHIVTSLLDVVGRLDEMLEEVRQR